MKKYLCIPLMMFSCYSYSQCPAGSITSEQNLVVNGDFEERNKSFASDYLYHKSEGAGHYSIVTDAAIFSNEYFRGKGDGFFMAVDGAAGVNKTVWKQLINVKKNTNYFFSCWVNTLNVSTGPPAVLQFSINGKLLDKPFHCPNQLHKWEQFSVLWNSGNEENAVVRIVSQNPHLHGNDFGLDCIKFYECTEVQLKIEENKSIVLRNVLFETNSASLLESSYSELNKLVDYLSKNIDKTIAVFGYTDNVGSEEFNQKLSEERARSVMTYMLQCGIDGSRMTFLGHGENNPIASNETIEGRQKNRRVEFIINAN
ncbi:OmpA family protein [Breznakibacter xylanolyticus]|uniref:OmpA family protein n=1 Tax=Breznakibacter xylanolyticus TaxID=990 RepID=A0A2W7NGB7_9BACT|nr:OmpA family protein [Breznakibacter xylanolyticus]PZX17227.1 OmpA family protein [Breznakibacter xylanolyticus]